MTEDEMVVWHHGLNGHECEQAPGVGDGQGNELGPPRYSPLPTLGCQNAVSQAGDMVNFPGEAPPPPTKCP